MVWLYCRQFYTLHSYFAKLPTIWVKTPWNSQFAEPDLWNYLNMFHNGTSSNNSSIIFKWFSMKDVQNCQNRETLSVQLSWILLLPAVLPKFRFESQTKLYLLLPNNNFAFALNKQESFEFKLSKQFCKGKYSLVCFSSTFLQNYSDFQWITRPMQCLAVKGNLSDVNTNIACAAL